MYDIKDSSYFDGARLDFIETLPDNPNATILEIGCSNGNTGALALKHNKCSKYIGVDIHEGAAEKAKNKISEIIVGNIETMEPPWTENSFDVLILSEVLEHLIDPWNALKKLHKYLKPGAIVLASTPNVSHYKIIFMLLKGHWNLTDAGVMDRTHLRWFTPKTLAEMFESTGYHVDKVEPTFPLNMSKRIRMALLFGKANHLFVKQMKIKAHKI